MCQGRNYTVAHDKLYFVNPMVEKTWDADEKVGMSDFSLVKGHYDAKLA
jgi:hypothetical protein